MFKCYTNRRLNRVHVTDERIGSPISAARWFFDQAAFSDSEKVDLKIYVLWNKQEFSYAIDERGALYSVGS